MFRSMFGYDAPPEVVSAMRDVSVGQLADKLRQYGPGGGTASAFGEDGLLSGVRGIQEELGIPTALENYKRYAELIRKLPEDVLSTAQASQEPITESQMRALEAQRGEPLSKGLEGASDYLQLLQQLAAPRISALETEYAARQRQPTMVSGGGDGSVSRAFATGGDGGGFTSQQELPDYQQLGDVVKDKTLDLDRALQSGGLSFATPQTQALSQTPRYSIPGIYGQAVGDILGDIGQAIPKSASELFKNITDIGRLFKL